MRIKIPNLRPYFTLVRRIETSRGGNQVDKTAKQVEVQCYSGT